MEKNESLRVGRFSCQELLGSSGAAETFRAQLPDLRGLARFYAVKLLRPDRAAESPGLASRFVEAGRVAQTLVDPAIVRIIEIGAEPGATFIASEFVEGVDLRKLAEETRGTTGKGVDPTLVAHIGAEVATALAAAHGRAPAVLHDGLAPGNVILTPGGEVKVLDFGIGAALRDRASDEVSRWQYLAPEVVAGGKATPRADLYALGALLYELLTGRPPVEALSIDELEQKLRRPSISWAGIPEPMVRVLRGLLAAKPEDRPESAVAAALQLSGIPEMRRRLGDLVQRVTSPGMAAVGATAPAPAALSPFQKEPTRLSPLTVAGGAPRPGGAPVLARIAVGPPRRPPPRPAPVEESRDVIFDPEAVGMTETPGTQPSGLETAPAWNLPAAGTGAFQVSSLSQVEQAPDLIVEIEGDGSEGAAGGGGLETGGMADVGDVDMGPGTFKGPAPAVPAFSLDAGGTPPAFADSFFDVPSGTEMPAMRPRAPAPEPPSRTTAMGVAVHIEPPVASFDDGIVRSGAPDVSEFLAANPGIAMEELKGEPVESVRSKVPRATTFRARPTSVGGVASVGGSARADGMVDHWYDSTRNRVLLTVVLVGIAGGAVWLVRGGGPTTSVLTDERAAGDKAAASGAGPTAKGKAGATATGAPAGATGVAGGKSGGATGKAGAAGKGTAFASASPAPAAGAKGKGEAGGKGELAGKGEAGTTKGKTEMASAAGTKSEAAGKGEAGTTKGKTEVASAAAGSKGEASTAGGKAATPGAAGAAAGVGGKVAAPTAAVGAEAVVKGKGEVASAADVASWKGIAGRLAVATEPPGATIWVDGESRGVSPVVLKLSPGAHRVALIKPGYQMYKETVDVTAGDLLSRKLPAGEKPPRGDAGIKVRCATNDKYPVVVDGIDTGQICPTERIDLTPGEHDVGIFVPKEHEVMTARLTFQPSRSSTRVYFKY